MGDYRTAKKHYNSRRVGKYSASTTELLLEEICQSVGTELLQAYVNPDNGTKLVRRSTPIIVEHPNGTKRVLQFQYTKFSPFHSHNWLNIYNKNRSMEPRKGKVELAVANREIYSQHEEWNPFEEVTYRNYIKHLGLHRWEKELYFAVYDVEDDESLEDKLKPFLIHEDSEFNGKLPSIRITFRVSPVFVIGGRGEDRSKIYDSLWVTFPQVFKEHLSGIDTAFNLHPLNKLTSPQEAFKDNNSYSGFGFSYKINSLVRRQLTMSAINAYLRKHSLDKSFY